MAQEHAVGNLEKPVNGHTRPAVENEPLNIIIVGAGIGGLTAAIYLRRQGHIVSVFEQSRFANEVGAAVHLAPNSNGIMRRIGLKAEEFGGNELRRFTNYDAKGNLVASRDNTAMSEMWQHKYLLVHRVRLHEALKKKATGSDWPGTPVKLQISSRIIDVDTVTGTIILENSEEVQGDVVIGADGVHSKMRTKVPPGNISARSSGQNAFRFLLPKSALLAEPELAKYVQYDGDLIIWHGPKRRIVMYPCNNNTMFNFVAIHPATETDVEGSGYNYEGEKDKLLKVFSDFDPSLLALISKMDGESLKLWSLLDMDDLPSWTKEKLVLLGDAAHPYTPHQGQGAGQAMEDGATIAVVLPLGTKPHEVPERLRLFEQFRYERAVRIQAFSRKMGQDGVRIPEPEMRQEMGYHLGHDAWDSAVQLFRKWQWAQNPNLYWRMPTAFGPMPGPRQDFYGKPRDGTNSISTKVSIKFKTSRTLIAGLLPNEKFSFSAPGTVAYATFSMTTLDNLDWLAGGGYNIFQLTLHGVQYKKENGDIVRGTFIPLLFEDLADPIVSGREELGMPKLYCNIDVHRRANSVRVQLSWRGAVFGTMTVEDLQDTISSNGETNGGANSDLPPEASLMWRAIAGVGIQGQPESEYCTIAPAANVQDTNSAPPKVIKAGKASVNFDALDWEALPTIHHIASRLAEIPVFQVLEASLTYATGVPNLSTTRRVE